MEVRRAVGTRPRRWLVASTLLLGVAVAAAVTAGTPPGELTFAVLAEPVQSVMSVTVPFMTSLLARDLRRDPDAGRLRPTLLTAVLLAAVIGAFGVLVCVVALAVTPAAAAADPWQHGGTIAVGSVLVQVVAGLVGTGLGLLLRSWAAAFALSVVLPLGLWLILGGVDVLRPAQAWLTPYSTVRTALSGGMTALAWVQWLVVFLLWAVGLNLAGAAALRRRPATTSAPTA